jgi:hypothetical protein
LIARTRFQADAKKTMENCKKINLLEPHTIFELMAVIVLNAGEIEINNVCGPTFNVWLVFIMH